MTSKRPWPCEAIPSNAIFYRVVHHTQMDNRLRHLPRVGCFDPSADPDKALSLYWSRDRLSGRGYATPRKVWCHVGLTQKMGQNRLKPIADYRVYSIDWSQLKLLDDVDSMTHSPSYVNKYIWGRPCNRSHSSLRYHNLPVDEEVLVKVRRLAKEVPRERSPEPIIKWITDNKRHLPFI